MPLFWSRSVCVEARQVPLYPSMEDLTDIFDWLKKDELVGGFGISHIGHIDFYSRESRVRAKFGDWIVKSMNGYSRYTPEQFEEWFQIDKTMVRDA